MRRSFQNIVVLICLLAAASIAPSVQPTLVARAEATEAPGYDTFLGFEPGEERRYAVGPEDALRDGDSMTWSVRLERVETEGARDVGVFNLTHRRSRVGMSPRGGVVVSWVYAGEARINEYGFPERVSFTMYEEHTGESPWRGEDMSADYVFTGDEYRKEVRVPDQEWQFTVPIATHDDLDLDLPAGAFLFRPRAAGTNFFTNPALLGFVLPDTLPDSWRERVMFFQPTYPVRHPSPDYVMNERDTRAALGRYWSKNTLELGESARLEIGNRVLNVRKLDITGPLRTAYVDEFGRVVRVDIDPDEYTRQARHIRLLFPDEY